MSDANTPVIVSAVRTPVGRYLGGLSPLPAPRLGALVIKEAVRRAGVGAPPGDGVILGHVPHGGEGQAPARPAGSPPGPPGGVPPLPGHKGCGSRRKGAMLAA